MKIEKNIVLKALVSALLMSGAASFAQTESKLDSSKNTLAMETIVASGRVIEVGTSNDDISNKMALKGFAKDMPLLTVLKQITPNGWVVKKSDSKEDPLNVQSLVSWTGGNNWIDTLKEISNNYNYNFVIVWSLKTITVSKPKTISVPSSVLTSSSNTPSVKIESNEKSVGLFELEGTTKDIAVGASEIKRNSEVIQLEKPIQVVVKTWEKISGKSLRENVLTWGEKAGYKVVWLGEDYPVDDSRVLTGEFDSEVGPIKQLAIDYGPDSRVQKPLSFQFYQNNTLVIENWEFEQSGFPISNKPNIK